MSVLFVICAVILVVFSVFDVPVPQSWVNRATAAVSQDGLKVACGGVTVKLWRGLCLRDLSLDDLSRRDRSQPAASAEKITVTILPLRVRVVAARFDRLGDGYYHPECAAPKTAKSPIGPIELPDVPEFALVLESPSILGIAPRSLVCDVNVEKRKVEFSRIRLEWPERQTPMSLSGSSTVDFETLRLTGGIDGTALQSHIRPLLVALDLPSSWPYMDAFTEVRGPVRSGCSWDVDLRTGEYTLDIPIHPQMGRYNGVAMSRADGGVGVHVAFPTNALAYDVRVGPLTAYDSFGRLLDGTITVHGTNDAVNLEFNAVSELPLKSLLNVMDVLNDGTLDCIACETSPKVTAKGVYATDPHRQRDNDFGGTMSFSRGSILGLPLEDVRADYRWKGADVTFTNLVASGRKGGRFSGAAVLSLPELDPDRARYRLDIGYRDGRIGELKAVTPGELSEIYGNVRGELHVDGPLGTNTLSGTCGRGRVKITDGRLAQLKLFLGMTAILAEKVPGVAALVNQSDATADFTISNGVLRTENAVIEGSLISLSAKGSYDMVKDDLAFTVGVRLLKDDSVLGRYLVRPVTWAFSKYLMELEVKGPIEKPKWRYAPIIDHRSSGFDIRNIL